LSTCSSHLMVVAIFFGSGIITYLRPKSSHSARTDKFLSLFYTIVTPMFNPLIYCLRNKDVGIEKISSEMDCIMTKTMTIKFGFYLSCFYELNLLFIQYF
jgi:olfactory receptor